MPTAKTIAANNTNATSIEATSLFAPAAKKDIVTAINIGNLPLHGIKLFVSIEMFLSRSFSMILHPVTPQALQPIPIAIVRLCLP